MAHEAARHAAAEKWAPAVVTVEPGTPIEHALARGLAASVLRRLRRHPGDDHLTQALGVIRSYGLAHDLELPIEATQLEVSWPGSRYADAGALFEKVADAMRTRRSGTFLALDDAGRLPREHVADVLRAAGEISGAGKAFELVVTGLPGTIPPGAPRFAELRSLTPPEVLDALAWPAAELGVELRHDTVAAIGRRTGGHPYYVQSFAEAAWQVADNGRITPSDIAHVAWDVEQRLGTTVFAPAVAGLGPGELAFAETVARLRGEATFAAVATALGDASAVDPDASALAPIRDRLLHDEVLFVGQSGVLEFVVPYLDRYLVSRAALAAPARPAAPPVATLAPVVTFPPVVEAAPLITEPVPIVVERAPTGEFQLPPELDPVFGFEHDPTPVDRTPVDPTPREVW